MTEFCFDMGFYLFFEINIDEHLLFTQESEVKLLKYCKLRRAEMQAYQSAIQ